MIFGYENNNDAKITFDITKLMSFFWQALTFWSKMVKIVQLINFKSENPVFIFDDSVVISSKFSDTHFDFSRQNCVSSFYWCPPASTLSWKRK